MGMPVRAQYSAAPKLKMSVRASSGRSSTCSGAMKSGVPCMRCLIVPRAQLCPKSMIFTAPSSPTMMLLGFMSAWMKPRACMWARAWATPRKISSTLSTCLGRVACTLLPGQNSISRCSSLTLKNQRRRLSR